MKRLFTILTICLILTGCSSPKAEVVESDNVTLMDPFPERTATTEGILVDPTFAGVKYYKIVGNYGQVTNVLMALDTPEGLSQMVSELSLLLDLEFNEDELKQFFDKANPKHTESTSEFGITFRKAQGMIEADIYELISQ